MFKLAKGWTKTKVMNRIKKYNNGKPAKNKDGICLYKANGGNRCAIGCFIPDGHPALKSRLAIADLLGEFPDLAKHLPFKGTKALEIFQNAHDGVGSNGYSDVHKSVKAFLKEEVSGK